MLKKSLFVLLILTLVLVLFVPLTAFASSLAPLSSDATLAGITASAGSLSPEFSADVYSYTLNVDSQEVTSVTVTPQVHIPGATIKINGTTPASIKVCLTSTTSVNCAILVTALDGVTKNTYNVRVRSMSRGCDVLSATSPLSLVDGRILTATVNSDVTSLTINLNLSPNATWKLYGDSGCNEEIVNTTMSFPEEGLYRPFVKVTSESGRNSKVYPVLVYKQGGYPEIVAFDSNFNQTYVSLVHKSDIRIKLFGTKPLTATVLKNNLPYSWNGSALFTQNGHYVVTLTDGNTNSAGFSFTIDKICPVITAKYPNGYKVYNNSYTKNNVTVKITDTNLSTITATRNGDTFPWLNGSQLTEDGTYAFTAIDRAGNTASLTFTIDKTLPVITANEGALLSGDNVNTNVTVSVSDTNLCGKYVKRNGYSMAWPSGGVFTLTGKYDITAKDRAGNIGTFSFIIDKVIPVISVKTTYGSTVHINDTTKYDVYVKVCDSSPLSSKTITRTDLTGTDIPIEWPSNNKFTLEGEYSVTATDVAGNTTAAFIFTIDKPARFTVTENFSGETIKNGGYASEAVTISFDERYYASKTLTKDGNPMIWFNDNTAHVDDNGVYIVTVKDAVGNTSKFTFTIDFTPPDIKAKAASGAEISNNGSCKESGVTVAVTDKYLVSKTATKDGKPIRWPSYSRFTSEGVYIITAVDKAGNDPTFTFTIDRVKPSIACKAVASQSSIADGATVADSVEITVTDRASVTNILKKDDVSITWPGDNIVTEGGVYSITSIDAVGLTSTFTFTIDRPSLGITAIDSFGIKLENNDFTAAGKVTLTVTGWVNGYVNKDSNSSLYFPPNGVLELTGEGRYYVDIEDGEGNHAELLFYIDRTAPVITASTFKGPFSGGITSAYVTVTAEDPYTPESAMTYTVLKDGATSSYPENGYFNVEGAYEVTATDGAGSSSSTFTFTLDRTRPVITAADSDMAPVGEGGYSAKDVTVTITDNYSAFSNLTITADRNNSPITYPADGKFSEEGFYYITATDEAGYIAGLLFTIDKTAPEIRARDYPYFVTGVAEGSTVTTGVTVQILDWNFSSVIVKKDNVTYRKNPLEAGDDESLLWDFNISPGLDLLENGNYEITATDKAGHTSTLTFTINIPIPE